ncbi:GGDEF domain-containing protein [Janthinobacterium sp. HH01]|uniref:sensor domain-containing diguanylate cyclase n=1 Tax=Janthinobacterium sp. HH01 TaxID=1198452 RepID=UPI0002AEC168|nr:sensor domain-containing diguanylate cyclase [Janthinobacterium sp. HH01]ELX12606.1 GGDEF domain-containing protein [Janthinobacterium sp. HH01]
MKNKTETGQPRKRLRLATLVTLGVCATVALSTALQLALVDHFATNYAGKEAELRLQQLSWQMRDSLNRVVSKAAGDVQLVTALAQVREARDPAAARAVLDSLQDSFPDYAWIGIAGQDGKVFAAAHGLLENADVSARPWFKAGQVGLRTIDYHPALLLGKLLPQAADPWRFIDVAAPVRRADGQPWGVLGVHMSWNWARRLARNLLTPALREYGAEILVVRNDATVLLGPAGMEEKKLNTTSLQLAQAGQTGAIRETWPDGKVYLTGYSQTGQSGDTATLQWSVLVRQPEQVAMAASRQLEQLILWLSVAAGAAMALVAAFLARRLTRPMDRLSRTIEQRAKAVEEGRPLPEVPAIDGFREAQVLSRAMREMVYSEARHVDLLQTMNEQLESTVARRTAELEQLVMRDVLTGLPNRRALMQALPAAMARVTRMRQPCAVLFLDLDGFKNVNDTHGHEEGDELLRQFGQRIVGAVRRTDTVARLAGDEFVAILENLSDAAAAEEMGRKMMPLLREPFVLKTATVKLSASIGIAIHQPGDAEDLDALLARADRAMYEAKRGGKNNVVMAAAASV